MKLMFAFVLSMLAQALSFIQLQGQMKWSFPKDHPFIMMLLGLPISLVWIYTTRLFNEHFEANWPGRLIGFGGGIIMFTIMSWMVFREPLTPKTIVCLSLGVLIILIQIFWK